MRPGRHSARSATRSSTARSPSWGSFPIFGPALKVDVVLLEHFVSDEINAGVAAVNQFDSAFDADGDLEELRTTFERKAHVAAQERLARALGPGDLARLTVAEAAERAPDETAGVLRRRERLGIRSDYALCDDEGAPLSEDRLPGWLRFARTVRVSIDGNAGFCRGLLETRYGLEKVAGARGGL